MEYFNPYAGQSFFGFLAIFLKRVWALFTGQLGIEGLVSDEIQIFVLSGIAISGAMVGTFLVLRRMTMLANALSHTILIGIVATYLLLKAEGMLTLPTLILASLITGIFTTFLTQFLTSVIKLQEDASIGLVFSVLFALGIVLVSLFARNLHIGTDLVMGNVDALKREDLRVVFTILAINGVIFLFFFNGFKITTFDPQLARTLGFPPLFFNYLLMIQTSATSIGGFRAVGVLMILAFLVIPVLIARLLTHSLLKLIGWAMSIGVISSIGGVALSRHILTTCGVGLSTGGIVVTLLGLLYLIAVFFAPQRGRVAQWLYQKKLNRQTEINR